KINIFFQAVTLAAVCAVISGCSGAPPAAPKEAPRVTIAHPTARNIVDEEEFNGWLEPYKTSVDVRARVRGHLRQIHFQDGDIVQKDQPLFDIDSDPFKAELSQTEAQAKALEAQEIAAKKDVERNEQLIKTSAVSQQELDKSRADAKSYESQIVAKK